MRSMTGFGRAQKEFGCDKIGLEISSVNKRNFEVVLSGPREWHAYEVHASKILKSKISRGRIRISISVESHKKDKIQIFDKKNFDSDLTEFKFLLKEYCGDITINPETILEILKLRNSNETKLPPFPEVAETLDDLLSEATDELLKMKKVEGQVLKEDMTKRVSIIKGLMPKIESEGINMPKDFKERLLHKLNSSDLYIDTEDERVLKEVSLFAEKSDISEEITRVNSHIKQLESTFEESESIGRKIEFLLQEIGRELNTVCAKSNKVECTKLALDARVELDKLREQSLNIE